MPPKSNYKIPFDAITGDLIEWIDPDIASGKDSIPLRWFDTQENGFVSEPEFYLYMGERSESNPRFIVYQKERELFDFRVASGRYEKRELFHLLPNKPFGDCLRYKGYSRGRSSAKIIFESEINGSSYGMFLTDFDGLMEQVGMNALNGRGVSGQFSFVKRGQNYGIKLAD